MEQFNLNNYIKRIAGFFESPAQTIRTLIDEEAKFDALASIVLSNIINAIMTALWVIYLNFKQSLVQLSLFKYVFKSVINTNLTLAICIAAYFFVGKGLGGNGTPMGVFVAFGFVSVLITAVSTIGNMWPILVYPATIIGFLLGYVACKEAHGFENPKEVVITAVVASVAISAVNYVISFII